MFTRCTRCVMPTTRPDTAFVDGVCSACLSFEKRSEIDWTQRLDELKALIDRHKGRCIVPSSGGKDSTYQVLKLIELGAKPLVVTATTCMLTPTGRANIDNLAHYAPTIEVSPNKVVRAKLNRLALEMVGDISWPEHASIFSTPFRMANSLGVPIIIYGENPQEAYGGPLGTETAVEMTRRWTTEFGGFLGLRPQDFVGVEEITEDDMAFYQFPAAPSIDFEAHFLGAYVPWNSHHNAEVAIEAGLHTAAPSHANWWHYENLDNAQTGVHDFFGFLKYGYGRLAAQVSVDIRYGIVTREGAMNVVRACDGAFPLYYMGVPLARVLHNIGMGSERFVQICNEFLNRDLFVEDKVAWGKNLTLKEFA